MAIEVIAKIKQKNNGTFKLMDAVDVEMSNGQDLQTYLDNLKVGGGNNVVYVGESPPTTEEIDKYEIFIDKSASSGLQGAVNNIDNVFMNEIRNMFQSLQTTIEKQQKTINDLQARVFYLESLHGEVSPDVRVEDALLTEKGGLFLLENGGTLLLENIRIPETHKPSIMLENGNLMLLENGGRFILENAEEEQKVVSILLENGGFLRTENGGKILLEQSAKEEIKGTKRLLLENGGMFILENGGVLHLENSYNQEETKRIMLENGGLFLLENGAKLHLEDSLIEMENGQAVIKLENGGDLLLENGGQIILEFSEEEYALLLENGSILLNEKDGRIILD